MGNFGYRQTFEPNKCQHPIGYCCFTDIFVPPNTLFSLAILHFHLDLDGNSGCNSQLAGGRELLAAGIFREYMVVMFV